MNDDTPEQFLKSGKAHYYKGEFDKAIVDFTQAIELNPDYADAYNHRGIADEGKGEYDLAIEDYTQALTLKPDFAKAFYNRAGAYTHKGEYDKAIADFTQAIELKPDYAEAYNHRGIAYKSKGKYDPAIADYTQAIALKPDYADAWYNRGVIYRATSREEEAKKDFQEANKLDPTLVIQKAIKEIKNQVKEIGDQVKETEDFQSIFKRLEKDFTSLQKRWFWGFILSVSVTLAVIVIGLPTLLSWFRLPPLDPSNSPAVNQYTIYVFCSVVTMIIIRQYTNAKQLRIEASHRLAMAKIFTYVNPEDVADYKEFTLPIINAIANSMDKTQTPNSTEVLALMDRLVHKK